MIKRLLIGSFPFNCLQRAGGWAPLKAEHVPFMSPRGPGHRRVRMCREPGSRLGASGSDATVNLQAWASPEPCGICPVTEATQVLVLPSGNLKERFLCEPAMKARGLGRWRTPAQDPVADLAGC